MITCSKFLLDKDAIALTDLFHPPYLRYRCIDIDKKEGFHTLILFLRQNL